MDMDPEEFRRLGYKLIDWISEYLSKVEDYPVLSRVEPGAIRRDLADSFPEEGEDFDQIINDFQKVILPGITHWNHPAFFAYFPITGSCPGILGELLCAALNVNGMLWRTSPSATELEQTVVAWLREMLGLPSSLWGIIYDSASMSTFHALAAARHLGGGESMKTEGLQRQDQPLCLYTSEQAHSSVQKAAIALGLGLNNVREVPVDRHYRMDVAALKEMVKRDLKSGSKPLAVVATIGTTSTTSIDPIPDIGAFCRESDIWLHVDAAYGGAAAVVPEMRWVLDGCEFANSVVVNPHKWLFTPIDLSVLYTANSDVLKETFSLTASYLETSEGGAVTNYMDYGVPLGRRFRALKLWFVLRYFGRRGLAMRLRRHMEWARELSEIIDSDPDFERMAPVPFSTVCFRFNPHSHALPSSTLDSLNERLMEAVNASGQCYLSQTRLGGDYVLRIAIGNLRTQVHHIDQAWEIVRTQAKQILANRV